MLSFRSIEPAQAAHAAACDAHIDAIFSAPPSPGAARGFKIPACVAPQFSPANQASSLEQLAAQAKADGTFSDDTFDAAHAEAEDTDLRPFTGRRSDMYRMHAFLLTYHADQSGPFKYRTDIIDPSGGLTFIWQASEDAVRRAAFEEIDKMIRDGRRGD